jgi:hypothetical protein
MNPEAHSPDNSNTYLAADPEGNLVEVTVHEDGTRTSEVTTDVPRIAAWFRGLQVLHELENPVVEGPDDSVDAGVFASGPNLDRIREQIAQRDSGPTE